MLIFLIVILLLVLDRYFYLYLVVLQHRTSNLILMFWLITFLQVV